MAEQNTAPPDAGAIYEQATGLSFDDSRRGLKYVLLRLSTLGLTDQEQEELRELARLAFNGLDVKEVAGRVINMKSVSPLASAIADIVQHSEGRMSNMTTTKMAVIGAVFGAYAAHFIARSDDGHETVLAAIAGAIAVSTSEFLQTVHQNDSWMSFLQRD